jgi:hypothetical protein
MKSSSRTSSATPLFPSSRPSPTAKRFQRPDTIETTTIKSKLCSFATEEQCRHIESFTNLLKAAQAQTQAGSSSKKAKSAAKSSAQTDVTGDVTDTDSTGVVNAAAAAGAAAGTGAGFSTAAVAASQKGGLTALNTPATKNALFQVTYGSGGIAGTYIRMRSVVLWPTLSTRSLNTR